MHWGKIRELSPLAKNFAVDSVPIADDVSRCAFPAVGFGELPDTIRRSGVLHRKQGATIAAVMKATGWQPRSVRGFLTAVVRKKIGLTLVSEKGGEERVYHIVANDVSSKRKGRPGRQAA